MRHDGTPNLKPVTTKEEARERGKSGGIKSGEVRREKKLLSQMYTELLAETNGLSSGPLRDVVTKILERNDSASVSMLKEIREATEGSKVEMTARPVVIDEVYKGLMGKDGTPKE